MKRNISGPLANAILASLNRSDFGRLAPSLKEIRLKQGVLLYEPGDETEHVYFPHSGMVSLLAVLGDGDAIEIATIGREGVIGAMAGLGLHSTLQRAVIQLPLVASRMTAAAFRKAVQASGTLRDMAISSNQMLLAHVQTTAACNALHEVEERLSRWILQSRDRNETDVIRLTQEFLSQMLGVRRSSVSDAASGLQRAGVIRYSRGVIEILNRKALEAASCECYGALRRIAAQAEA